MGIELDAYSNMLPKLIAFEKSRCENSSRLEDQLPKLYAGGANKDTKGSFFILEDISDQFAVVQSKDGLSMTQIELGLENLAHFHALSYAYGQIEKVDYSQIYPIVQGPNLMEENELVTNVPRRFQSLLKDMNDSE